MLITKFRDSLFSLMRHLYQHKWNNFMRSGNGWARFNLDSVGLLCELVKCAFWVTSKFCKFKTQTVRLRQVRTWHNHSTLMFTSRKFVRISQYSRDSWKMSARKKLLFHSMTWWGAEVCLTRGWSVPRSPMRALYVLHFFKEILLSFILSHLCHFTLMVDLDYTDCLHFRFHPLWFHRTLQCLGDDH